MSYVDNPYRSPGIFASQAAANERADFITKTYIHLAGAIALFAAIEVVLLNLPGIDGLVHAMFASQLSWLVVLGLFMVVSYIANSWAVSATSPATQYMGLGLYVVAQAVIFVPLLYIARAYDQVNDTGIITSAAVSTLLLFGGMTVVVFITRKDFSFLRGILMFGTFAALGFVVLAMIFHYPVGGIFTYAMIALVCGYILYDTSNVLHHYRIGQHVAASLALFSSVALLFWYVLQLFLSRRN
jgi:FtsH-binding integral membrane protein